MPALERPDWLRPRSRPQGRAVHRRGARRAGGPSHPRRSRAAELREDLRRHRAPRSRPARRAVHARAGADLRAAARRAGRRGRAGDRHGRPPARARAAARCTSTSARTATARRSSRRSRSGRCPGAPVSCPLEWREVTARLDPARFTIRTVPRRFARRADPLRPVLGAGIEIAAVLARMEARARRARSGRSSRAHGPARGRNLAGPAPALSPSQRLATRVQHGDPLRLRCSALPRGRRRGSAPGREPRSSSRLRHADGMNDVAGAPARPSSVASISTPTSGSPRTIASVWSSSVAISSVPRGPKTVCASGPTDASSSNSRRRGAMARPI